MQTWTTGGCTATLTGTSPNYTLTIAPTPPAATGAMADYTSSSTMPWYSYQSNIKTLIIEEGVTRIGTYAFYSCNYLTGSLTIHNSVTFIGNAAFMYCAGITSLTIPASVTSYGYDILDYCSGLTEIHVSWTDPPYVGYQAGLPVSTILLYIPCGSMATYRHADDGDGWNFFDYIIEETATASDINVTGSTSICPGATASLTASSNIQDLTYKWYESASATATLLYTGATYTPTPTSTTTYYVAASSGIYCENAADDRKAVTVTVEPKLNSSSSKLACSGVPFTYTATSATSGTTFC
ncbi:MAG: leucine-rich repeat protein [Prevotellaceae bacterium]|nr:leucine-rich repeat protein [Prevotellaceae bacterium]